MAGKKGGRKPKSGKRTPTGQLSRAGQPREAIVQPSDWVQGQLKRFGNHYCWALGRAYACGLIGDGVEANARLDAAKKFVRLYQRFIGGSVYTCPLDDSPRGTDNTPMEISDRQIADREWLDAAMDAMDVAGVRQYFDQLTSRQHIDTGPAWLDRMLNSHIHDHRDTIILKAALKALDVIAPETPQLRIVSTGC